MGKGEHSPDKLKFWRRHISQCKSSGLTQKQYCRRHGLHIRSFHYWKQIITLAASAAKPPQSEIERAEHNRLIPLSVIPDASPRRETDSSAAGIQLRVGGYAVDLSVGFHVDTLRTLLLVLG